MIKVCFARFQIKSPVCSRGLSGPHHQWSAAACLEARPSEETHLGATSLSSLCTSRDGSRVGFLSPLGPWLMLVGVAVSEGFGVRVWESPGNFTTTGLVGAGSRLFSSAAPVRATAKNVHCCGGVMGHQELHRPQRCHRQDVFSVLIGTQNYDNTVNSGDSSGPQG